jgi:hypothetical protein
MPIPYHTLSFHDGAIPAYSDRVLAGMFSSLPIPATANALTALGAVTPGSGYTSANQITLAFTGGTGSGGTAQVLSLKAVSAAPAAGGAGTGYTTGDTITLPNGVVLTVTATAGAITGLAVTNAGSVVNAPKNPNVPLATSGGGSGAMINLSWGLGVVALTNSGNYTAAPTGMTVNDNAPVPGTGGAVAAPTLGGAGAAVTIGLAGLRLPSVYQVQALASVPAFIAAPVKTVTGFAVSLTPTAAGGSFTGGTVDVLLLG